MERGREEAAGSGPASKGGGGGGFYGADSGPVSETNTLRWRKATLSLCVCCRVLIRRSLFTWGRKKILLICVVI